jgi:hypothetical protein
MMTDRTSGDNNGQSQSANRGRAGLFHLKRNGAPDEKKRPARQVDKSARRATRPPKANKSLAAPKAHFCVVRHSARPAAQIQRPNYPAKLQPRQWSTGGAFFFAPRHAPACHLTCPTGKLLLNAGGGAAMQDYEAHRLLNQGINWRALFIWTGIIATFSLLSLASVAFFR